MSAQRIRVLGVDTSLRSTGLGVIEAEGNRLKYMMSATLKMPKTLLLSQCIAKIYESVASSIERYSPSEAALESGFFAKNVATTTILGEARGAVIAACACKGLSVYEYAPRRVKQAVACHGAAGKDQVARMVSKFLGINTEIGDDETDALAIAICHVNNKSGYGELLLKRI